MLETLILKCLSKKGAIELLVGQIAFYAMLAFYILVIADYSLTEGKPVFFGDGRYFLNLVSNLSLIVEKAK